VDGHRVGTRLAQAAGLSRQVANGYLQALLRDNLVEAEGTTRARVYRLRTLEVTRRYAREGLQEDLVWRELISPVVARLAQNVRDIWHYAATEMINNAIDHSGSQQVEVSVGMNALWTEVLVADKGEGIFVKIRRALDLHDPREAILELDFAGISEIGQAFADELFRVFANAHPRIRITPINAEPAVAQMIKRAVAARAAQTGGESAT
jgi:hypothetical protein